MSRRALPMNTSSRGASETYRLQARGIGDPGRQERGRRASSVPAHRSPKAFSALRRSLLRSSDDSYQQPLGFLLNGEDVGANLFQRAQRLRLVEVAREAHLV